MGATDSCLETSICPPAFIPDHSYEIKFNKNLFPSATNEMKSNPFLNNWAQWDRTAEETSCSTCISQVRPVLFYAPVEELRENNAALVLFGFSGVAGARDAPLPGRSIVQPFQSESPSALLSEIGNPFSWTRFLASPTEETAKKTTRSFH